MATAWATLASPTAAATATAAPAVAPAAAAVTAPLRLERLDDFRDAAAWQASASDQVQARARRDRDGSLCLDYDFGGVSGYAVLSRRLPVDWPERFDLALRYKGRGAPNDFQFKLVDAGGDNVWWMNRPDHTPPAVLTPLTIRRRHIGFAWGPAADRRLRRTERIEFVVAAGRGGGAGSLCVADLVLRERAPDPDPWPAPRMQVRGRTLDIDLGAEREFNGLEIAWPSPTRPRGASLATRDYDVHAASGPGRRWRLLRRVRGAIDDRQALFLPESEARRLRVVRRRGAGQPQVALKSADQWPTLNAVLATQAAQRRRGEMPRAFLGEQNYWTLVGVDGGGERSGLIGEDGAIELGRGGPSIEPVVGVGTFEGEGAVAGAASAAGATAAATTVPRPAPAPPTAALATWADVEIAHSLVDGELPLPRVHWRHAAFALDIEAAADGPAPAPWLLARYRLRNTGARTAAFSLQLLLRPWQVNPPQQFLTTPGGARPIGVVAWQHATLSVDGRPALHPTPPPQRVDALPSDAGPGLAPWPAARPLGRLHDPQAHASARLVWTVTLAPGEARTFGWVAPLAPAPAAAVPASTAAARTPAAGARDSRPGSGMAFAERAAPAPAALDARFAAAEAAWRERLSRVRIAGPGDLASTARSVRTALAHLLMSRDGAALRPGTRSYARTWIRDGAMMTAALLRLGEDEVARAFVDGYAPHLFASGKVPCCVDARGADPVVENDSHGQYLYAVAEVLRHGAGDAGFLQRHWPHVQRVVAWLEALRQSNRTDAQRAPGREHLFGLLPPSISHEGYSDRPAYSFWDDFWALRGYKDAAWIAQAAGDPARALAWQDAGREFERELGAAIEATARHHGLTTIAGAADRGDFDPTSTTVALDPAQAALPAALLEATFERYCDEARRRADGRQAWQDYTPYEWRNVGALVRLGQGGCAHALRAFLFRHQRPAGWNQWAEVVLPDARTPKFLGDMPHAWVASDFIRSALDLLAYAREDDGALVLGAGWAPGWLAGPDDLVLRGARLGGARLDYRLQRTPGGWSLHLELAAAPARLRWPVDGALPHARHEGRALAWQGRELALPPAPAVVELQLP